jgi:hypothetical protein
VANIAASMNRTISVYGASSDGSDLPIKVHRIPAALDY